MSTATAIGLVSQALRTLLLDKMTLQPLPKVTILAPDEPGGDGARINLFLYKVQESAELKNLDWQISRADPNKMQAPPLSLNLHYLMTPYAKNDLELGNGTAHAILGDAMRVLYEHAILPAECLPVGLHDATEQIQVMLNPLDLDEMTRIWSTFSQPFRLSICYEVSVVQLDVQADEKEVAQPVRYFRFAEKKMPLVQELAPLRGPAGSEITIRGEHLAGWRAAVFMNDRQIHAVEKLADDVFAASLPDDLIPGPYEIWIDIADVARRTFPYEILEEDDDR